MKILVIGAGGVGGYFGARLAEAGNEVTFVARGRHREAMAADGLRVLSQRGDLHLPIVSVVDTPSRADQADIVLVCTKLWDLRGALEASRPVVGPQTGVIALQNGIDKDAVAIEVLGREAVMGGTAHIAAKIEKPGVIRHTGTMAKLIYGELDGRSSSRLETFDLAVKSAEGMRATRSDDVRLEIWKKFTFLAPFAGITCHARSPIGPIREDPDLRRVLETLVFEACAVGRAAGAPLDAERESQVMEAMDALPAEMKSSMLHDLEAGNRLELDWLTGAVVRLGREHGVHTPQSAAVYDALAPFKDGS